MMNIYKSSSNGTFKTLEDFQQAAELLQNGFDRLQEINNGTYNQALFGPIAFNGSTCPELAASIKGIQATLDKIRAYFEKQDVTPKQDVSSLQTLASRISEDSIFNIEAVLGYPVTADILEDLEDHLLEVLEQMPEEELEQLEEKYAVSPVEERE